MASPPGRNDPCPCGSGRKFKHCCLHKADADDQARVNVRRAEGRVIPEVFSDALHRFGKPFFEEAWLEFWLDETPDADSFRRSETQLAALLARAVAHGQRNL